MTEKDDASNSSADEPMQPGSPDAPSAPAGPTGYRRLRALSGVALAVFLVVHLFTNASALGGERSYDRVVGALARSRLVSVVELVLVFVPLVIYVGSFLRSRREEEEVEAFGSRRAWALQRITALAIFVFVLVHVWELRFQRVFSGLAADALYTTLAARLSSTWAGVPWVALLYLLGVAAAAAHFGNGLFAALAPRPAASSGDGRRRVRLFTAALGALLFLVGGATVIGLATGTRLLPGADDDSAASAPCGSAVPAPSPPFKLRTPSP